MNPHPIGDSGSHLKMMKKLYTSVILSTLLVLPVTTLYQPLYPVFAEEGRPIPIKEKFHERKENVASKTAERKEKITDHKVKVASFSAERKAKVASKEAELKNKLSLFRDKKKASLVEKINHRLLQINSKSTTHFQEMIDKMNKIVERLETKIATEEANGADVTSIRNAVSEAKAAITAAQTAVDTQTEKDYSVVVSTETKVSEDARLAKNNLHNDLKTTHDLMVTARQSLAKAISTAQSNLGGENSGSN